ncbi:MULTISPECIES: hypothetical protein [Microbacterium]|uniref:DUF4352 domain-containing protein n=1 Tax=Microbacterium wangchenii TaxID=2541726 RepID=A0ABX5STA6_9MICO|nr:MULTISPECIES: hypothetical protein [Microbacterium]MCK6065025.1 hypothetical protein [Microbacterium sp. EYE_512]QBR88495.1 hypothetical protein E4K62_07220 [Microbacterium wangchenii]TXK20222.1 hypothetical protein FVP99_00835 [Microbacterium wangchenii]
MSGRSVPPALHQPYPGAPPVYGPDPRRTTPSQGPSGLAVTALVLGAVCLAAAVVPVAGRLLLVPLLPAAVIVAVVAIVRRAVPRGLPITALVLAGASAAIAAWSFVIPWGLPSWPWEAGDAPPAIDEPFVPDDPGNADPPLEPELGVPGLEGAGASRADPLAYGTTITIVDENSGSDVWAMTVTAPEDVTAASGAVETEPANGAYLAVTVELTNLGGDVLDPASDYDYSLYSWLLTGDGGRADSEHLPELTGLPSTWDIPPVPAGDTVRYAEVFDVATDVSATGYFVLELPGDRLVYWGPAG